MHKKLLLLLVLVTAPGCSACNFTFSNPGCDNKPMFLWYPSYLWDPESKERDDRLRDQPVPPLF